MFVAGELLLSGVNKYVVLFCYTMQSGTIVMWSEAFQECTKFIHIRRYILYFLVIICLAASCEPN